jgi:hypothetical protein
MPIDHPDTVVDIDRSMPGAVYYCGIGCWRASSHSPANPFARLVIAMDRLAVIASRT